MLFGYIFMENTNDIKEISAEKKELIERMFEAGTHYGYSKSRRHPSSKGYIFGTKNKTDIFDLEKTSDTLIKAKKFISEVAMSGKAILFVSSKPEAGKLIREVAESIGEPYVVGRWIGGTITNFDTIKKRVAKLLDLTTKKESGALAKYTKKEQLLMSREADKLEVKFGGISGMPTYPGAIFVIDLKKEDIVVQEAKAKKIPIVSLSSSDCNLALAEYSIPGNDTNQKSISFFLKEIASAHKAGKMSKK